jgi:hypothetical protein
MANKHPGSCLCGSVRFEVEGTFLRFYLCHCGHCRKDTGSAHGANLFASRARLNWITGRDQVRQFNLPSTRHTRCFCSVCGSALPYEAADEGSVVVPAGSLDGTVGLRPDAHIFVSSRADWDRQLDTLPSFAGLPS